MARTPRSSVSLNTGRHRARRRVPRPGIVLAAAASAFAVGAAAVPSATAATTHKPNVAAGVHFLVTTDTANSVADGTTLQKNGYYESFAQFADFGLTIDGAFALAAAKSDNTVLRKVVTFIQSGKDESGRTVSGWTGIGTQYASAGAIGKEALLAEATGYNPRSFGGKNLIAALDKETCTKATTDGSCSGPGDFQYATSTFDQALAIMALLRVNQVKQATAGIGALEKLQHTNGSWSAIIPAESDSDPDSTAMAMMALAMVPGAEKLVLANENPAPKHKHATGKTKKAKPPTKMAKTAAADLEHALKWFHSGRQDKDGGFTGASGISTNSTALAIQGLKLGGKRFNKEIGRAENFLGAEQQKNGGFAIAAAGSQTSDVRASTQVVGGIIGTSFGALSDKLTKTTK
jgi:prenyltransferase beta subunit